MKIILLAPGSGRKVINNRRILLSELVKKKHDVILCATGYEKCLVREPNKLGIIIREIPLSHSDINPLKDIVSIFAICRLILKTKPDIVFAYGMKLLVYGSIAASFARIPNYYCMMTGLGYGFGIDSFRQRALGSLLRIMLMVALLKPRSIFFQNPDDLNYFIKSRLVKPEQSILINGSGVDINYFSFSPIITSPLTFLLICRLVKAKGVAEFVHAAKEIKRKYPDIVFNLIGPFVNHSDMILPCQIKSWVNQGLINYLGEVQDVRPSIRASSVFVLPSYYREGIPRTVLEAMAMGRPIITTKSPGCRETVEDGNNGFLIPPKDVDALVGAMKAFIAEPQLVKKMGTQSRIIAEKKFEIHKISRFMIEKMGL